MRLLPCAIAEQQLQRRRDLAVARRDLDPPGGQGLRPAARSRPTCLTASAKRDIRVRALAAIAFGGGPGALQRLLVDPVRSRPGR